MKKILVVILFLQTSWAFAQQNLMPIPSKMTAQQGKCRLKKDFQIALNGVFSGKLPQNATRFLRRLDQRTGIFFEQQILSKKDQNPQALFQIQSDTIGKVQLHENESYTLSISSEKIRLSAKTDIGAMRGLETLLQLLEADQEGYFFPTIEINDSPRFVWRGLMIDVARHFQPLEVIKRNIDAMAAVKLNVLHLHLTDNQGFRVETKTFPKLHELGSDGDYFTQNQIREIVDYATQRGIRVVPEFDLPAHATAWLVGYPELGSAKKDYTIERKAGIFDPVLDPTNEKVYDFLDKLFAEILPLFPDEYVHIGGDENEEGKDWKQNPDIQEFMKKNKIADNHALQAYFNQRMLKIFEKYNKKMIGWEEILHPNLPKTAVIHSWFGKKSLFEAAKQGYQTLLSNGFYIDLMHSVDEHYLNDLILPEGENLSDAQKARILGGEATMWSELVTQQTIDARIWPRMAAIAERLWSPAQVNDLKDLHRRLPIISQQLEEHGLTHIKNQDVILRNLSRGKELTPLKNLAAVCEPMKVYNRNPNGDLYTMLSPLTLFADACTADAPDARIFNGLVADFLDKNQQANHAQIKFLLEKWQKNHTSLKEIIQVSPVLKEIEELSENLSKIAVLGLHALDCKEMPDLDWYKNALVVLENARKQGGRTELQVVNAVERLVKSKCGQIPAYFTEKPVTIDANLDEWANAEWNYFTHSNWYFWKDTCQYALRWDDKNLYLAFKVSNRNLQASRKQRDEKGLHEDDGIEFLLDTDYDKTDEWKNDDLAYHVNILNAIIDDRGSLPDGNYNNSWNGKAKTAVKVFGTINNPKDRDKGYQVEVAISWKEIGKTPSEALQMGINLCVNDRDDNTQKYRYMDYMKLSVFHKPSGFVRLRLLKKQL